MESKVYTHHTFLKHIAAVTLLLGAAVFAMPSQAAVLEINPTMKAAPVQLAYVNRGVGGVRHPAVRTPAVRHPVVRTPAVRHPVTHPKARHYHRNHPYHR